MTCQHSIQPPPLFRETLTVTSSRNGPSGFVPAPACFCCGPSVAVPDDNDQEPLTARLARKLSTDKGVKDDRRLGDPSNLRAVAQFLVDYGDRDRQRSDQLDLAYETRDFYECYSGRTTPLHEHLASLPFRLCITTTPDDFMFNAFTAAGKTPQRAAYRFNSTAELTIPEPSEIRPLVFHLYGHPTDPASLVLTERNLIDFLLKVGAKDPPLPHRITGQLGNPLDHVSVHRIRLSKLVSARAAASAEFLQPGK